MLTQFSNQRKFAVSAGNKKLDYSIAPRHQKKLLTLSLKKSAGNKSF